MREPVVFGVLRRDALLGLEPGDLVRVWFSRGIVKCGDRTIATNYGHLAYLASEGAITWITHSQHLLPPPQEHLRLMA
jgi:hypothetical protein